MSRRAYRALCGLIAATSVTVAATGVYFVSESGKATAVELDSVLDEFRSAGDEASDEAGGGDPSPEATVAPGPAGDEVGPEEAVPATTTSAAPAPTDTAAPTTAPPTTSPPPAAPAGPTPFVRPEPGVYTFGASGSEKISVAGANHKYPGEVYGVLTYTQCGYQLALHILEEHVDTFQVCLADTRLTFVQVHQKITFLGQTQAGSIACDPAALFVDRGTLTSSRNADCRAGTIKAVGPVTQRGEVEMQVGGTTVKGMVAEWAWTATGDSSGSGKMTFTVGPDGVPLRLERSSTTESNTILGRVTHQESGIFVLRSLNPRR